MKPFIRSLLLPATILFLSHDAFAFTVVIDPGHGGYDNGANYSVGTEKRIVLEVSKKLAKLIESNPQFKVKMTRSSDSPRSLKKRAEMAQSFSGDLFLSIHANSSPDSRAIGAEFFFQHQLPPEKSSLFLARREEHHGGRISDEERMSFGPAHKNPYVKSILEDLIRTQSIHSSADLSVHLVEQWKGYKKSKKYVIQQAEFYVVSNVPMPSVLVELGFLTHKKEGPLLSQKSYQNKLAQSIYDGLIKYKESLDKTL